MKTRASLTALLCILTICLCLNNTADASQDHTDEVLITKELKTLSTAIADLAKQMQKQAENAQKDTALQKLDIAIAYLSLRSRRIEMFERELHSSRSNRNRLDTALEQIQSEEDGLSQTFDTNQREMKQRASEELNFRRRIVKDRISRLDEEIILLENRIMDMQSQIDSVESFVQKNLEF
ncbi:MAG: hypothetical protein RQ722_02420 [Desulfuromonadales bacterium]|nr:hypothetical protein [Desulfuromonadales bacterium]